ncbi:MAG: acyl-CoA dehydrogenase family protein [Desulfobacterium sp.]|nr:acyl-CoA dehydrogenase family protein [Desulfobacterium sp.]
MDFELTKSQKQIQKAAKDFAKGEFDKETLLTLEKENCFPLSIWEKASDLGFVGIHFDDEFSGAGLGLFENVLLAEAFCAKDSSAGAALMLASHGSEMLLRFGSKALKETFLPRVAEGEMISSGALGEAGTGYGVATIATTALAQKDQWIINGEKAWVTNGGDAGFYLVLCVTDPDVAPEKAMGLFLVEKETPGITVTDSGRKLGCCMVKTATLTFDNVRVPLSNLVGKKGDGFAQVEGFLNEQRIVTAGIALGTAQGALERAVAYVREREQFGRKIARFEALRHKIATMAIQVDLARLATYRAASNFDRGKISQAETHMALEAAAAAAEAVADAAIQLHGGAGYITETGVEHFYRDAKFIGIHDSNQGLRLGSIANHVIGKLKG